MATGKQQTRKEQREEARARRRELEAQRAAAAQRKRRMYQLGAVVGAAIVVVIVAIAVSSGGGGGPSGIAKGKQANQTVSSVNSMLGGVTQTGNVLGNPKAPATMEYFGDLECPVCRDFTLSVLPQVVQNEVRSGKLKIQYRSLQTATQDPSIFQQQQAAAVAAGRQNLEWQYVELFYHEQGQEGSNYVNENFLQTLANQVPGLNMSAWNQARHDPALAQQVSSDQSAASQAGYSSTPTLVIHGPKGTKTIVGVPPNGASDVASAVNAVS
jgi:protein-disulfide isomerase